MVAAIILFPPSPHTFKLFDVLERSNKHFLLGLCSISEENICFWTWEVMGIQGLREKVRLLVHPWSGTSQIIDAFAIHDTEVSICLFDSNACVWLYSVFSTIFHDGLPWTRCHCHFWLQLRTHFSLLSISWCNLFCYLLRYFTLHLLQWE